MTREDIETICLFCVENGIVMLADEVYQRNVYADDRKFFSAKKVAMETLVRWRKCSGTSKLYVAETNPCCLPCCLCAIEGLLSSRIGELSFDE